MPAEIPLIVPEKLFTDLQKVADLLAAIKSDARTVSTSLGGGPAVSVTGGRGGAGGGAGGGAATSRAEETSRKRRINDLREEAMLMDQLAQKTLDRGKKATTTERQIAAERKKSARELASLADAAERDRSVDIKNRRKEILGLGKAEETVITQRERAWSKAYRFQRQQEKEIHKLRVQLLQAEDTLRDKYAKEEQRRQVRAAREEKRRQDQALRDERNRLREIDRISRSASGLRIGGSGFSAMGSAFVRLGGFMPASTAGTILRQTVTGGLLGIGIGTSGASIAGTSGRSLGNFLGNRYGPMAAGLGGALGSAMGVSSQLAGTFFGITGGTTGGILFAGVKAIEQAIFSLARMASRLTSSVLSLTKRYGTLGLGTATALTGAGLVAAGSRQRAEQGLSTVAGASAPWLSRVAQSQSNRLFSRTSRTQALTLGVAFGMTPEQAATYLPMVEDAAAIFGTDIVEGLKSIPRAALQGDAELAEQIGLNLRERSVAQTLGRKVNFENPAERAQAVFEAATIQLQKYKGGAEAISRTIPGGFASVAAGGQDFLSTLGLSFAERFGLAGKQRGIAEYLSGPKGQTLAGQIGTFFGSTANRALAFGKNTLMPMAREFISTETEGTLADKAGTAVFDFIKKLPEYFQAGWKMAKAFFSWLYENVRSLVNFVTGTETWSALSSRLISEWDKFFEHAKSSDWRAIGSQIASGAVDSFVNIHNKAVAPLAKEAVKGVAKASGGWGLLAAMGVGATSGGSIGAGIGATAGTIAGGVGGAGVGAAPGGLTGGAVGYGVGALIGATGAGLGYMGITGYRPWESHAGGGITNHPIVRVGESGPELVALPVGSRVMPNSELRNAVRGYAGGGVINPLKWKNPLGGTLRGIQSAAGWVRDQSDNRKWFGRRLDDATEGLFGVSRSPEYSQTQLTTEARELLLATQAREALGMPLNPKLYTKVGFPKISLKYAWKQPLAAESEHNRELANQAQARLLERQMLADQGIGGATPHYYSRHVRIPPKEKGPGINLEDFGGGGSANQTPHYDEYQRAKRFRSIMSSEGGYNIGEFAGGFSALVDKGRSFVSNLLDPGTFAPTSGQTPTPQPQQPDVSAMMGAIQSFLGGVQGAQLNPLLAGGVPQKEVGSITNHGPIYINGDRNNRMRSAQVVAA